MEDQYFLKQQIGEEMAFLTGAVDETGRFEKNLKHV